MAAVITSGRADGYSSDVVAFDAAGREHLVRKSFAQRRLDYLFESPGPGATQVLSSRLARVVRDELLGTDRVAARCEFHDWITYAICRARGWAW